MNVFDCKEPKEHSTAYKVGRGELKWRILVESCFVYKGAFCECGQFSSEGRCQDWKFRQRVSQHFSSDSRDSK